MKSIEYITTWTSYLTGAAAGLITFSCIVTGYGFFMAGDDLQKGMEKLGKRIRAGIFLILITSMIAFLKRYWL